MKLRRYGPILAVLAGLMMSQSVVWAEQRSIPADSIRVEDGDTLSITLDGKPLRIQLIGIDAPEDRDNPKLRVDLKRTGLTAEALRPMGESATRLLRFLVDTQGPVFLLDYRPEQPDRYGRIPGDLRGRNQTDSVAEQMLSDGYAITIGRGLPQQRAEALKARESQARKTGRGIWRLYPEVSRAWAGR